MSDHMKDMTEEELDLVKQYEESDREGKGKLVEEHKVIITNISEAEDGMIEMTMDLCKKYESTLQELSKEYGETIEETIVRVIKDQIKRYEEDKDATKEDV